MFLTPLAYLIAATEINKVQVSDCQLMVTTDNCSTLIGSKTVYVVIYVVIYVFQCHWLCIKFINPACSRLFPYW
jgi:hypothetical protein